MRNILAVLFALLGVALIARARQAPPRAPSPGGGSGAAVAPAPGASPAPAGGAPPTPVAGAARKRLPTATGAVSANFYARGAPAWRNQAGGVEPLSGRSYPSGSHTGTDYSGPPGTAVYAPFSLSVLRIGNYTDSGRAGYFVIGTLDDGAEFYAGHLATVNVRGGQAVPVGAVIGTMNNLAHTHIQLRINGQLADFEAYYAKR